MPSFNERRRARRVSVEQHRLSVAITTRVHLLDIAAGGVLMASTTAVPAATGTLSFALPAGRIRSLIQVRHQSHPQAGLVHLGAQFIDLGSDGRRSLEQFLANAAH